MRGLNALARWPRLVLIGLVRAYRLLLSPWVGQSCRFEPTCSRYAIAALDRHGALLGSGLTAWRVLRCNPWCHGGCDPVPDNAPWRRAKSTPSPPSAAGLFTGLLRHDSGAAAAGASFAAPNRDDPTFSKTSS